MEQRLQGIVYAVQCVVDIFFCMRSGDTKAAIALDPSIQEQLEETSAYIMCIIKTRPPVPIIGDALR